MRHLLSPSTASLFPLVRHGGRFAQSGKDPRALLVPSYKTAKTAKTAPVGICGPVWPPGGGMIYVRRHAVADVAMDATVDGGMIGRMIVLDNTELIRQATLSK
jgi:hypothetical protein